MSKPLIICIIDDDDVYQFTITKAIQKNSIVKKILVFSDGKEGIDFLIDNVANVEDIPDIIFLDINMPIMDGWQFLEQYVKLKPRVGKKVTIYMISSSVDPIDVKRAKAMSEISDYLIKPIKSEQVKEIIEKIKKENGNF